MALLGSPYSRGRLHIFLAEQRQITKCYDLFIVKMNKSQSFWVWCTAIALLMAALMPTLSQAARSQSGADLLSPICTSAGMKWFDASTGEIREQTAQNDSDAATEHCVWCSVHPIIILAHILEIPPLFLDLAAPALPVYLAVSHPFAWPPSSPRAPPPVA